MYISVVVTIRNEAQTVVKLLSLLAKQTKKPYEIILVDGGSTDQTVKLIESEIVNKGFRNLKLFIKPGNRSVGRNYGIRKAKNEIIAVTDAGGYPSKFWLEKITEPFNNPKVMVVSGYCKSIARSVFEKCITPYFLVMPNKIYRGMEFLPSSRSVAFRKSVWRSIGGYPEAFWHNEDLVFDYRIKQAGYAFYFEPRAIVWWQLPENLTKAAKMFFRYSFGDAESGINRPAVKFIFLRYGIGLLLLLASFYTSPALILLLLLITLYFLWSVAKNFRYVGNWQGLVWLPIIQITADISVMTGSIIGILRKANYD